MAHPGAGALGVRPEEQRRLSRGERERLGEGRRSGGKVRYCASPISGPVPVGAMFVLRRTSTGSDVVLRRLDAVDPLLLLGSTFNLSVRTPERLHRQLDVCARMADEVPILALDVPPAVDASALAARVRAWTETGA